ncbi:MAG: hypothetical protein Q9226_004279 [Calogaya cf. arnoldii]
MEPPTSKSGPAPTFPLMRLPLELRRRIYSLALPAQDTPLRSNSWSRIIGGKYNGGQHNHFMNLLVANKEVSHEAREVLYGLNCFTVLLSSSTEFLPWSYQPDRYELFPSKPSMKHIKNWQLDLDLYTGYERSIAAGLLDTSEELAKIDKLQTLKVRFPCICKATNDPNHLLSRENRSATMKLILQPLKRLHFAKSATFIAAPTGTKSYGDIDVSYTKSTQCTEANCLAFVASFDDLKHFLEDPTLSRLQPTEQQKQWLDIRQRLTRCRWSWLHGLTGQIRSSLFILWNTVTDVRLEKERSQDTTPYASDFECLYKHVRKQAIAEEAFLEMIADGYKREEELEGVKELEGSTELEGSEELEGSKELEDSTELEGNKEFGGHDCRLPLIDIVDCDAWRIRLGRKRQTRASKIYKRIRRTRLMREYVLARTRRLSGHTRGNRAKGSMKDRTKGSTKRSTKGSIKGGTKGGTKGS